MVVKWWVTRGSVGVRASGVMMFLEIGRETRDGMKADRRKSKREADMAGLCCLILTEGINITSEQFVKLSVGGLFAAQHSLLVSTLNAVYVYVYSHGSSGVSVSTG